MNHRTVLALSVAAIGMLAACGGADSSSTEAEKSSSETVQKSVANDPAKCLSTATTNSDADQLEADMACAMSVTDKVTIKFVAPEESYGCMPYVVGVAPPSSAREYVRVAITHGTDKEYTGLVKLENKVLTDRKSGWRNYGWPGNSPLENCSELPMKIVSVTCKVSGEKDFVPCEDDVEILAPGMFASEEF